MEMLTRGKEGHGHGREGQKGSDIEGKGRVKRGEHFLVCIVNFSHCLPGSVATLIMKWEE